MPSQLSGWKSRFFVTMRSLARAWRWAASERGTKVRSVVIVVAVAFNLAIFNSLDPLAVFVLCTPLIMPLWVLYRVLTGKPVGRRS